MDERPQRTIKTAGKGLDRLSAAFARRCEIDLRTLAVFRMSLGLLLLLDLTLRSRNLRSFYSDSGVLPRKALFADYGTVYSIHTLSGELWFQALLFGIAGLFAILLLIGYRTRIATIASWLMLFSLHNRNPMVLNSGDSLFLLLCFWAIFLPLGERWAVDARSSDRDSAPATIATFAILAQTVVVYVTNAVHKARGELWMEGKAVVYIFQADQYTAFLGNYLATHHMLLEWFSMLWMVMLCLSPLLFLLTGIPRALLATLFIGMHIGMAMTMHLFMFPLISIAGLLLFYQSSVWDSATESGGQCSTRSFNIKNTVPLSGLLCRGQNYPRRLPNLSGNRVASSEPISIALIKCKNLLFGFIPFIMLFLILLSNTASVGMTSVPEPGEEILEVTRSDQDWQMFAPTPIRTTRWYVGTSILANGSKVDTLDGSTVDYTRPKAVESTYQTIRWRKYIANIHFVDNLHHRSYFGRYLCNRWNRRHETPVTTVGLVAMEETTDPYQNTTSSDRDVLLKYDCDGAFVQT